LSAAASSVSAAGLRCVDRRDQLRDRHAAVAVAVERRTTVDGGVAERDVDPTDQVVDRDAAVAVAVAARTSWSG
jgi:hypothetical protein